MATLILASKRALDEQSGRSTQLREWLAGHWAVLFSNPEDFAPHPGTPAGFVSRLSHDLAQCHAKAITLGEDIVPGRRSWIDDAVEDDSLVVLDGDSGEDTVLDFAERALALKVASLTGPFVLLLDENGCCRSTIIYRTAGYRNRDFRRRAATRARPEGNPAGRTIEDILRVIEVLRSGGTSMVPQSAQEHAERTPGRTSGRRPAHPAVSSSISSIH